MIDDELSEFLRPDWFKNYPLEAMVFDSECRDKYIGKCWRYETPGCQLQFPENYVTFHKRVTRVKQKLGFPEPGTCLIVFTHGLFVREFYRQATENQGYFAPIKYCGYASFV